MAISFIPFGIEFVQDSCSFFFACLLMYLLEFVHDLFAVIHPDFSTDIAHDMNQAALKMSFRISPGQGCFHANNTIRKKEFNLLQASGLYVLKHLCPNFNVLTRSNAVVNDFLMSIRFNANGNIYCFTLKRFSAQRKVCRIQIDTEKLVA